jgi:tryptophanyl-tRNA synthetase
VPDKKNLSQILSDVLAPIRERRERYASDPATVYDILADGNARARAVAQETMDAVRSPMKLKSADPVTR